MDFNLAPSVKAQYGDGELPFKTLDRRQGDLVESLVVEPGSSFKRRINITGNMTKEAPETDTTPVFQKQVQREKKREQHHQEKEEEQEPIHSPPRLKKKRMTETPMWRFLLYLTITTLCISFYAMVVRTARNNDTSVPEAALHMFGASSSRGYVYPLHSVHTDTKSSLFLTESVYAKPILAALEPSFRHHLTSNTQYSCLCMHHLNIGVDAQQRLQVCAVYNRAVDQLYLMANPRITGHSKRVDSYIESSISCAVNPPPAHDRYRSIFLEWDTPNGGEEVYARFEGEKAICMQIALDEMKGDAHCH